MRAIAFALLFCGFAIMGLEPGHMSEANMQLAADI